VSRKTENTGFACAHCGAEVKPLTNGSYRNHCPYCLYSLHVDYLPGDRAANCHGMMEPVRVIHHSKKGWQIVHRCLKCGTERVNRIAKDTDAPDNFDLILDLIKRSQ
jgi:DNA-directed RNA polymerase subunit RPC12/RpoP